MEAFVWSTMISPVFFTEQQQSPPRGGRSQMGGGEVEAAAAAVRGGGVRELITTTTGTEGSPGSYYSIVLLEAWPAAVRRLGCVRRGQGEICGRPHA